MITLKVKLSKREYPIIVGDGAFDEALKTFSQLVSQKRSVFCIADSAVLKAHTEKAKKLSGNERDALFSDIAYLVTKGPLYGIAEKGEVVSLCGGIIKDAVANLPERERKIIYLRYFRDKIPDYSFIQQVNIKRVYIIIKVVSTCITDCLFCMLFPFFHSCMGFCLHIYTFV